MPVAIAIASGSVNERRPGRRGPLIDCGAGGCVHDRPRATLATATIGKRHEG